MQLTGGKVRSKTNPVWFMELKSRAYFLPKKLFKEIEKHTQS